MEFAPFFPPCCYFARRSGWVNSGEFSGIARTASSRRRAIVSSRRGSRPPDARPRRPVCLMLRRNLIITVDWLASRAWTDRRVKCEKHRLICQWARRRWNDQDQICWQGRTQIRPKNDKNRNVAIKNGRKFLDYNISVLKLHWLSSPRYRENVNFRSISDNMEFSWGRMWTVRNERTSYSRCKRATSSSSSSTTACSPTVASLFSTWSTRLSCDHNHFIALAWWIVQQEQVTVQRVILTLSDVQRRGFCIVTGRGWGHTFVTVTKISE